MTYILQYAKIITTRARGKKKMKVAYIRVSTVEQNEARQMEAMKGFGIDKYFIEKKSGKDADRPQLQALLEFVREGDTVYIHSLDRLARSTKDLLAIVEQLQAKGVELHSNKESIDTSTATGKLMLTMLGAIAEFERQNLLERQREGIAIAKEQGKYKGRKQVKPDAWEEAYAKYKAREIKSVSELAKVLGISRPTVYKLIEQEQA